MNVVLVHGIFDNEASMGPLARFLISAGHHCVAPSLTPNDGRSGLPALAAQLAEFLRKSFLPHSRFAVVGFSMGAMVSRHYLQELGGHSRAIAYFSICGPHAGTLTAYLYPSEGARQLRPLSDFLVRLDSTRERLANIPTTCYWTPFDLMVIPVKSARWSMGDAVRIPALLHPLMLTDRRLFHDLASRLEQCRTRA